MFNSTTRCQILKLFVNSEYRNRSEIVNKLNFGLIQKTRYTLIARYSEPDQFLCQYLPWFSAHYKAISEIRWCRNRIQRKEPPAKKQRALLISFFLYLLIFSYFDSSVPYLQLFLFFYWRYQHFLVQEPGQEPGW